ncbi:Protein of uncharacterised function (DUF3274) [Yersinia pseudotuberculosis]|uniref:T6SS effector phospholipase Tle3 domain-containing protein n=1 Tax=Yersinia pseudotuberculosis TaxID=633 RepID=UPI0005EA1079|nr:DUF3274 domain-containing protein [Yersinia pseudotuberculosis]CNE18814.1 Protein of uncharacterised function (DUF3274) [Yersinia pseudotuberculosis]CNI99816.1 Protein of uncharacterised function (DUF3274) [Yersinia pseudotuberculosis]CNJ43283.1 Protein of uncharacterised function (DUF3274) [Yersinia pseudotuberculosis]
MTGTTGNNIRTPQVLSECDIARPKGSGPMTVQECGLQPPLPCIVIVVHGVNDVGEAYENQDKGICKGLNTRLGRSDLHAHNWKELEFKISDTEGNITTKTCTVQDHTCIGVYNRSPIIPFYWGYKPVDHDVFEQDQKRYRAELAQKGNDTDLPYDTYRENNAKKIEIHNGANIDNLKNWLDPSSAKGGGTFANATTCIPDMFGPGASGYLLEQVGLFKSRNDGLNKGDWSHPIYQNPHRIYQAYAARRLADLILDIRQNPDTENDTINIVAHSQGTIITMLANMWVEAEGLAPADCAILNHSPYSLENRWLEDFMPGEHQKDNGRQKTFANFCKLMAKNPHYKMGNVPHDATYIQALLDKGCLSKKAYDAGLWSDQHYSRNNFGMVYNYFCPNDQVVSMSPIQGFGWRGIPDNIKAQLGDNLYQRVFCRGVDVGDKTGYHFDMPAHRPDDSADTGYSYTDVTINAPLLPEPFTFALMAEGKGYKAALSGNDPDIAKAAMKAERFVTEVVEVPKSAQFAYMGNGSPLNESQLEEVRAANANHNWEIMRGVYNEINDYHKSLIVFRRMTDDELNQAVKMDTTFSQHSSIVVSDSAPALSMVYDLAIGQCEAFEDQAFWERLLLQADWRRGELNPDPDVKKYYQDGILPKDFKPIMNKPERQHGMPLGEFGVVNDYGPRAKPANLSPYSIGTIDIPQWDMPKPQV